jgi:hypothetical protein
MSKPNLRVVGKQSPFNEIMAQVVATADGLTQMRSFERSRQSGPANVRDALRIAGKTREQVEARTAQIEALPPVELWRPLRVFIETIYRHYIDPRGYAQAPQVHEMPNPAQTGISDELLAAACLELGVTRAELAAVACLRAVKDHPEIFAAGCDNAAQHQARIAEEEGKLRATLEKAAGAWTRSDIAYRAGFATFNLSGGAIHVGAGEGDVEPIAQLLHWLRANRNG